MNYKVDKNVPIPADRTGRRRTGYPFREMEVGDSFEFDFKDAGKVRNAACFHGKTNNKKFTVYAEPSKPKGRCWRTE